MKKMYEKTIRGYYVMSVVLGLLLALSVATMLEVAVLDAISAASDQMSAFLDDAWGYLPLNLCNWFWRPEIGTRNLNILMVTTSIMSVGIFVQMFGTKDARSKMSQATATALLTVLMMLAYGYATRGWICNAAFAMVPVILMVIPLMMLKRWRQRQPAEDGALELAQSLSDLRSALHVKGLRAKAKAFMEWWLNHKVLGYLVWVTVIVLVGALCVAGALGVFFFIG